MKYTFIQLSIFFLSGLFACQSDNSNRSAYTIDSSEVEDKSISETFSLPKLSKDNVVKVLSDFAEKNPETIVLIQTTLGDMKVKLYEGTPLHRANFLQLVKRGYYDGTVFHRVVKDLAIQGGNSDKAIFKKKKNEVGIYKIPAEINPQKYYHKKGALASPRDYENNPDKLSTPFEFYIVQGLKLTPFQLNAIAKENQINFNPEQIAAYTTNIGASHLDGQHTVFGEVIEGLELIDKIATVEVNKNDNWPLEDIVITMKVVK